MDCRSLKMSYRFNKNYFIISFYYAGIGMTEIKIKWNYTGNFGRSNTTKILMLGIFSIASGLCAISYTILYKNAQFFSHHIFAQERRNGSDIISLFLAFQ